MAIFKALEFDGVNSLDYGICITGEAVYNAPERAIEMVNIPGKNGALALDQGRFENIEVTYHAGCFADSQADFADKVMQFRNALASRYTYKRLTDEYHPDEYRLGLYKSGLDVDAVRYGTAGEFNIVFDCKPQRFLTDGDRAISPTEWSDVQTESGELVTIESDGSLAVRSLEVSLSPIQEGSGTPSPDNVRPISGRTEVVTQRTGKNLLPYPYQEVTHTSNGVTFTVNDDGSVTANGTATVITYFHFVTRSAEGSLGFLKTGNYIASPAPQGASSTTFRYQVRTNGTWVDVYTTQKEFSYVNGGGGLDAYSIRIESGATVNNVTFYPMLRLASETDATYEPYNSNTYTTALGRTVYGGMLDVVSGELTVTHGFTIFNGDEEWSLSGSGTSCNYRALASVIKHPRNDEIADILCNRFDAKTDDQVSASTIGISVYSSGYIRVCVDGQATTVSAFKTWLSSNNLQVVYELATPQTYQLTPQQIDLLLGTNHLWSDGEITVEYGVHPYYNPTPFESKPLIKVTGTGTLGIGEYILTITGTASQTLYIDCETMEIYTIEGTVPTGASSLVSINRNDFPVLEPGTNYISVGSGITAVTITPRWWRI